MNNVDLTSTSITSQLGKAAMFTSIDGYVDVPKLHDAGVSAATVEFWLNIESSNATGLQSIYSTEAYPSQHIHINTRADGHLEISTQASGVGEKQRTNQWLYVAFTFDGVAGLTQMFINGLLDGQRSGDPRTVFFNVGRIASWKASAARYFQGGLDEFAVYDKILNETRLVQHYNGEYWFEIIFIFFIFLFFVFSCICNCNIICKFFFY